MNTFCAESYLEPFANSCTDQDRRTILELADISRFSVLVRRRLLSLTESQSLPGRWSLSLFSELALINNGVLLRREAVSGPLTMICASTYLWLCSPRFGEVDDSAAAASVLCALKASAGRAEWIVHLKGLLAVVAQLHNPNPEARFFALLGVACCLQIVNQLSKEAEDVLIRQFDNSWGHQQGSVCQNLGVDSAVMLAWLDFLRNAPQFAGADNSSRGLLSMFVPEI
jgi:hypothetical protein